MAGPGSGTQGLAFQPRGRAAVSDDTSAACCNCLERCWGALGPWDVEGEYSARVLPSSPGHGSIRAPPLARRWPGVVASPVGLSSQDQGSAGYCVHTGTCLNAEGPGLGDRSLFVDELAQAERGRVICCKSGTKQGLTIPELVPVYYTTPGVLLDPCPQLPNETSPAARY